MSQAGLFSAVTSAFIIEVNSQLQPDPNQETAALLRVLIYKVDNTTFGDDIPTIPQPWTGPPRAIVEVQAVLFASLAASLFSAFLAMLGKQWLNRYASVDMRGSAIERSQNRQRKLDGIVSWSFDNVMESLPLMLQAALLLLGCALSRYLWEIDATVASVVLGVTSFGVLFYLFIVVAGAVFASCPYQTPGAHVIRCTLDTFRRIGDIPRRVPAIRRHFPHTLGTLHQVSSSLLKESFSHSVLVNSWDELKEDDYSLGGIATFLLWALSLPIWLVLDLCRAIVRPLANSSRWVYLRLQRGSKRQMAMLDQRCIAWTLRTSLAVPVRVSALEYLTTTTPDDFDPALVVDCFDILLGCVNVDHVAGAAGLAEERWELTVASSLCCLHLLSHLTAKHPMPRVVEDAHQRYTRFFQLHSTISYFTPLPFIAVNRVFYSWNQCHRLGRMEWEDYKPSNNELVVIACALAKISRFEYGRIGREKVPRWILRFALHSLSQSPLPPTSVVLECLAIIAVDLNLPSPIIRYSDERCVCAS